MTHLRHSGLFKRARPLSRRPIFEKHNPVFGRAADEFSDTGAPDIVLLNRAKTSRNQTPEPSYIARGMPIACDNSRTKNRGSSNGRFQPRSGTRAPIVRHALAAVEARILLGRPVALTAPRLKIHLAAIRQEHAPCGQEIGPRLVECRRGASLLFAGMASRIKPATPAPRIGVGWIARAETRRRSVPQPLRESNRKVAKRLVVGVVTILRNHGAGGAGELSPDVWRK
jgi:hypothetical protein